MGKDKTSELMAELDLALNYIALYTGNGAQKPFPKWSLRPNGDADAEIIAQHIRDTLDRYNPKPVVPVCRVYLVAIATGERELLWTGEDRTPHPAESTKLREQLQPGQYLQYTWREKDTTRYYLPADCPHTDGVLVCTYSASINRYQSGYSLPDIAEDVEDVWEWLNDASSGGDEEQETNDDEEWRFDCDMCGQHIKLELAEDETHLQIAEEETQS